MEIMPVPTCCKLHAHNYTCIPIILGRRGTLDPTGQLVEYYCVGMYTTRRAARHDFFMNLINPRVTRQTNTSSERIFSVDCKYRCFVIYKSGHVLHQSRLKWSMHITVFFVVYLVLFS